MLSNILIDPSSLKVVALFCFLLFLMLMIVKRL